MNENIINNKNEQQAILSGYVRYRPINKTFYLMLNSKRLSNLIRKNGETKVTVLRSNGIFQIWRDAEGNTLKPREREVVTCISGRELLTPEEKNKLQSRDNILSFPVKVTLNLNSFGLNLSDLYPDKDAAELADRLAKKGMQLPQRIMTAYSSKFDLIAMLGNTEITVEITRLAPSVKDKTHNFRHQPIGGNVRAHIFDTYRACVRRKLESKNNLQGFVIIDQHWKDYKHIKELIDECKEFNCHILFTKFENNWAEDVAQEIFEKST